MRHTNVTLAAINGHIYTVGDAELPDFTASTLRRRARRNTLVWYVVWAVVAVLGFLAGGS